MQIRAKTGIDFEGECEVDGWVRKTKSPKIIWLGEGRDNITKLKNCNFNPSLFVLSEKSDLSKYDLYHPVTKKYREIKKYNKLRFNSWTLYSEPYFKIASKSALTKINKTTYNKFVQDFWDYNQNTGLFDKILKGINDLSEGIVCIDGFIPKNELDFRTVINKTAWKGYHRINIEFKLKNMNEIILGNAIETLQRYEDNTFDLTVTSPPYDNMRTYNGKIKDEVVFEDGFSFPFVEMARELYRVTKKGGVVIWVVNDQVKNGGETGSSFKQALKFMEIGFTLYDTMIYHKNGAPFPETGRYSQVFEYMFVLSKGKPKTVNLLKDKPNRWAGHSNFGDPSKREKDGNLKKVDRFVVSEFGTRYNVWYINNGKGFSSKDDIAFQHPAIFPESLAEDHILSWSNEGDLVLDPMCGSGTTLKMAKLNNRNYVGIDLNQEYVDLSIRRVENLIPYNEETPNPKVKFLLSKEDALLKRKNNKESKKLSV